MLSQENVDTLQWTGEQNEPSTPSVASPSRYSVDPPPSVPMSLCYAVAPHELPDRDQVPTQTNINLISEDFNKVDYHDLLVKCFDCLPKEANLLARVVAAN